MALSLNVLRWVFSALSQNFHFKIFSSDLICRSVDGNSETFIELQSESELMRVLIAILICPTIGFISDAMMCLWKNYHKGSREVLYTAPAFISLISVKVPINFLNAQEFY